MIKDQPYEEPDAGKPHVRFCEGRALRGVRLLDPDFLGVLEEGFCETQGSGTVNKV